MHIVLSGYFGFDNVGDEAILFSIIQSLRKLEPTVEITVLSNNPADTAATYGVASVNRWNLGEVHRVIKHADGLISGGGSLMQDATSGKTIPYYAAVIKIAQMARVPVFIYSQGIGPINGSLGKWIVKKVFSKCHQITVRDQESLTLLQSIGVKKPIQLVPDAVTALAGKHFESKWLYNWLSSLESIEKVDEENSENELSEETALSTMPYITVSVRDWPTEAQYKKKIAQALDLLSNEGMHILFIPMHGEQDEAASNEVASLMSSETTVAPGSLSVEEKIAIIGGSKILIGMRLHSLIFAAIEHIPFIALSYDPKIDSFASIVNQPVVGHVEKDNWTPDDVANSVHDILNRYDEIVSSISAVVDDLSKQAENTTIMALNTFQNN